MTFPSAHRGKLHSTNPIERWNGEIKRRTEVVGIFPNEAAITRLASAILLEQIDKRRFSVPANGRGPMRPFLASLVAEAGAFERIENPIAYRYFEALRRSSLKLF